MASCCAARMELRCTAFSKSVGKTLPTPEASIAGNTKQIDFVADRTNDTLAERLRRRPAKPMGSPRVGSNPTGVVFSCGYCSSLTQGVSRNVAYTSGEHAKPGHTTSPRLRHGPHGATSLSTTSLHTR